jgi:hypothetical protein
MFDGVAAGPLLGKHQEIAVDQHGDLTEFALRPTEFARPLSRSSN